MLTDAESLIHARNIYEGVVSARMARDVRSGTSPHMIEIMRAEVEANFEMLGFLLGYKVADRVLTRPAVWPAGEQVAP